MYPPVRRTPRALVGAAAGIAVLAALAACTGDDADPEPDASPSGSASVEEVATEVSFGKVTGRLPREARGRLADRVQEIVDDWYDAAYLGAGESPADSAAEWLESCPGFTEDACAQARSDRSLTSLGKVADRVDAVEARARSVLLDVLAVKQRAVGVTARVRLVAATTGDLERTVRVRGRLLLSPQDGAWQVFGYDLTKGGA